MTTSPAQILVIEDDPAIRRGVVDALGFAGYAVIQAGDGTIGLAEANRQEFDLVLLDLVLPGRDGLSVLRELRASQPSLPVIVLTALGGEDDRVLGLSLGADDYVVKPFSVRELLARVSAVLRRSPGRPNEAARIDFPGGLADLGRRELRFADGRRDDLSEREAELFRYLACHRGRVVTREEILSSVWRLDPTGINTRTIDMHVARLRDKLRDDPARPKVLLTVRGQGYMLALACVPT
jgi:two-component system alkaline phosphatase synthesis response regulator PhoP